MRSVPLTEDLSAIAPVLAGMVATRSWLPHPDVVAKLKGAVFPTLRYKSKNPRGSEVIEGKFIQGLYDDNATPEWALFWSHEIRGSRPKGWTVAHVWPSSEDITAYTNVANLALIPEPFASLTDKNGPLTEYLRWHSWSTYCWKPEGAKNPMKPTRFDHIQWRYFAPIPDPLSVIRSRLEEKRDKRTKALYPIMKRLNMI